MEDLAGFDTLPITADPLFSRDMRPRFEQVGDRKVARVGTDSGTSICVLANGEVWSLDPDGRLRDRYINRDLEAFRDCLIGYTGLKPSIAAAASGIDALSVLLAETDPTALASPENWWSLIIWQHQGGLG